MDEVTSADGRRLVDLSHPIEPGMTTYPGLPGPVLSDFLSREDSRGRYAPGTTFSIARIEMVANTGTYVDAPFHRFAEGIGSLVVSVAVAILLIPTGLLLYREHLSAANVTGIVLCVAGLVLVMLK
jgi:Predicted metal-dependent hydrolase